MLQSQGKIGEPSQEESMSPKPGEQRQFQLEIWEGFSRTDFNVCVGLGLTTACSSDNVIIWLIASVRDH